MKQQRKVSKMIKCLTPDSLAYFIEITGLKILVSNTEYVLLKGFSTFFYEWVEPLQLYCLIDGVNR